MLLPFCFDFFVWCVLSFGAVGVMICIEFVVVPLREMEIGGFIMKYFKVPVRMDGKKVLREVRRGLYEPTRELIQNELYTEKEIIRFGMEYLKGKLEVVDISRRRIYWSFGARFAA